MVLLFSLTLFLSAGLMFVAELMTGKMLLPLLGGTPAVWNTCMMFFQGVLFLGYCYAHLVIRRLGLRRQVALHVIVLLVALIVLPIRVGEQAAASVPLETNPIPWLLGFLALATGLPLFAISATAPLLQRWFSNTQHPQARDPYFLYAASNAGSMVGLLSYPLLIERTLRLQTQTWLWTVGYGALVVLAFGCAFVALRSPRPATVAAVSFGNDLELTVRRRLRWVLLALAPSSLMLGVTTYLSTDVAPFPLLWVLPLALYLLTFILAFARHAVHPKVWMGRAVCILAILLMLLFIVQAHQLQWALVLLHLTFLFLASLVCHSTLARDRPPPARLSEFYLSLSFGGLLGGVFNSLVAPLVFPIVLEYPVAVILACALRSSEESDERSVGLSMRNVWWALATAALMFGVIVGMQIARVKPSSLNAAWMFGPPALVAYRFVKRPMRFALCLAAILGVGLWYANSMMRTTSVERNFFGVLRIATDRSHKFRELMHGTTLHGRAWLDPARQTEPTAYYSRTGPAGEFFADFDRRTASATVAAIGLGAGEMSSYARSVDDWTFFEINPAVVRVACNSNRFAFIKHSPAKRVGIVLGDARLQLRHAERGQYGVIILDAFNSDSIPVHLVTREAVRLYLDKLAGGGVLLFHISNRRLDLKPVVANLAHDAGLVALSCDDLVLKGGELLDGKEPSQWVVMARQEADLGSLVSNPRWQRLRPEPRQRLWTDDFSNVLQVIRWR